MEEPVDFDAIDGVDVESLLRDGWARFAEHQATPAPHISAVMRSWEERFGAVLVAVAPSMSWLAVQAPPSDPDQARLLAAEYIGFCPPPQESQPASLKDLAEKFSAQPATAPPASLDSQIRPDLWPVGWYD